MGLNLRAWTQLFMVWWTKDRIRVPRAEGKLFRVTQGDRLIIEERLLRVVSKSERDCDGVNHLVLTLEEEHSSSGELWYLSYSNHRGSANASSTTMDKRQSTREQIMLRHQETFCDLLPEQINVLRRETLRAF